MTTIFSIGEIAKLFNISTQALRLYDRIDLLKPSQINVSYDDILKYNKVIYKSLSIQLNSNEDIADKNIVKMPAGTYLTMYFDESSIDNRKYYGEMIDFIHKNNIKVVGDFLETAMVLRVNKDGNENTLAKLEILCS